MAILQVSKFWLSLVQKCLTCTHPISASQSQLAALAWLNTLGLKIICCPDAMLTPCTNVSYQLYCLLLVPTMVLWHIFHQPLHQALFVYY